MRNQALRPDVSAKPAHLELRNSEYLIPSRSYDRTTNLIINRDLSLIEFFRRVLDEALDHSQPLLERLKFLSIFSSNLDEFFMIRVPGLKARIDNVGVSHDGYSNSDLLTEIRKRVLEMVEFQSQCLQDEILPSLRSHGINVFRISELSGLQRNVLRNYFKTKIYPVLTPQAVDPTHPFPYITGGSLNLGLKVKPQLHERVAHALLNNGEDMFVRVKIPQFVPRFIPVDGCSESFVLVEDLVVANIKSLVAEADPQDCFAFRITRDADLELLEVEAADLLEMMEENLRQRRFGHVVRLEASSDMPPELVGYLADSLEIVPDDIYLIDGPINLSEFTFFSGFNRPELKDKPLKVSTPQIRGRGETTFDAIKRGDILLHHPYMPYGIVTDLIKEASEDLDVLAIKMCLYRMGAESPIPPLLIKASELGKQVTVLIEIKARFDEANNIEWGKRLEKAGVHVVYGLMGLKTHSKATLIVRREDGELRRYVHVATGNYNPETSAAYTDLGLLTADEQIGADVTELFNFLTVYSQREDFSQILVAPLNLREKMLGFIQREAENAQNGLPARIIAKFNRLADIEIVEALYEASKAGVRIDLIVRGICTLRPGVLGLSENIKVRSIVGRLLEHSRVYYFENGGSGEIYVGSSDWMPRNLDRRVEVLSPIHDPQIKNYLRNEYLEAYLLDNVKARTLGADGIYQRAVREPGDAAFDCQLSFQGNSNIIEFQSRQ
jgi:polyphosphate kinase